MNLGLAEFRADIKPEDKSDEHHIALYGKLLDMVPELVQNAPHLKALELGCGRGGGCYVMKNYFQIEHITAVDLSSANIRLAKTFVPTATFFVDDAVSFSSNEKFDLILNLESSHRYSSRAEFFKNVSSLLKEKGYFLFGDMIRKDKKEEVENLLLKNGFSILKTITANEGVVASIEKYSVIQYPIATKFPFLFPNRIHSFFVTIHSRSYNRLKTREVYYNLYLLQKHSL